MIRTPGSSASTPHRATWCSTRRPGKQFGPAPRRVRIGVSTALHQTNRGTFRSLASAGWPASRTLARQERIL